MREERPPQPTNLAQTSTLNRNSGKNCLTTYPASDFNLQTSFPELGQSVSRILLKNILLGSSAVIFKMARDKKDNSKAKEKKAKRLAEEKKMNDRVAIVKKANAVPDPLAELQSFKR